MHATTGLGVANMACAVQAALMRHEPRLAVVFGIGGAYPSSGLRKGDVAIASSETYADLGVRSLDGDHGLEKIGIPLVAIGKRKYFNSFPLHAGMARKAARLLGAPVGQFTTVSMCTGTLAHALELERRYPGVICENMEGAAAAQVCLINKVPLMELRAMSNIVEDRDPSKWDIALAASRAQEALMQIITKL